jgi:hemerythrin-like metal-binding protein
LISSTRMFDMLSDLQAGMAKDHGKDRVEDILHRLIDYRVEHFTAEETVTEKHKFPGVAAHRAEHRVLTDRVPAFKKELEAGKGRVPPGWPRLCNSGFRTTSRASTSNTAIS